MPIVWRRQEDSHGCAISCLAMVTARTYAEVKAAWPASHDFSSEGVDCDAVCQYLGDRHIAHVKRYLFELGLNRCGAQVVRKEWPAPFAPVHIISIDGSRHDVVLLADGTVLDPMREELRQIEDVGFISIMVGVWPDIRLPRLEPSC